MGIQDADNKVDFRIIEEEYSSETESNLGEKYYFKNDVNVTKQYYVVLFENQDNYIVAPLFWEEDNVLIDRNIQKVISKKEVMTYYCPNIKEISITNDWQGIVAKCSFLNHSQVEVIYNIYDKVYNYNYYYKLTEEKKEGVIKEKIPQYKELKKIVYNDSEDNKGMYKELLDVLEEYAQAKVLG